MCSLNDYPPYECNDGGDDEDVYYVPLDYEKGVMEEPPCDCTYCLMDEVYESDLLSDSIIREYPTHGKLFSEELVNLDSSNIFSARQKLNLIATKILRHQRYGCYSCITEWTW